MLVACHVKGGHASTSCSATTLAGMPMHVSLCMMNGMCIARVTRDSYDSIVNEVVAFLYSLQLSQAMRVACAIHMQPHRSSMTVPSKSFVTLPHSLAYSIQKFQIDIGHAGTTSSLAALHVCLCGCLLSSPSFTGQTLHQ